MFSLTLLYAVWWDKNQGEEGKNGLSVINAIKNKILLRVVAVINKKQPYVDNQKIAA